jgi:hypothetical protein
MDSTITRLLSRCESVRADINMEFLYCKEKEGYYIVNKDGEYLTMDRGTIFHIVRGSHICSFSKFKHDYFVIPDREARTDRRYGHHFRGMKGHLNFKAVDISGCPCEEGGKLYSKFISLGAAIRFDHTDYGHIEVVKIGEFGCYDFESIKKSANKVNNTINPGVIVDACNERRMQVIESDGKNLLGYRDENRHMVICEVTIKNDKIESARSSRLNGKRVRVRGTAIPCTYEEYDFSIVIK